VHPAVSDGGERGVRAEHRRVRAVDAAQRGRLDERLIVVPLAAGRAVAIVELVRSLAVEREPRLLEVEALTGPAEVDQLDVVPRRGLAVLLREPEIALAGDQRGSLSDDTEQEGVGGEVVADGRDVDGLERQRSRERLRWLRETGLHGDVACRGGRRDERKACGVRRLRRRGEGSAG